MDLNYKWLVYYVSQLYSLYIIIRYNGMSNCTFCKMVIYLEHYVQWFYHWNIVYHSYSIMCNFYIMYRLGGGEDDVKEIQTHPFFSVINWDDLVNKKVIFSVTNLAVTCHICVLLAYLHATHGASYICIWVCLNGPFSFLFLKNQT